MALWGIKQVQCSWQTSCAAYPYLNHVWSLFYELCLVSIFVIILSKWSIYSCLASYSCLFLLTDAKLNWMFCYSELFLLIAKCNLYMSAGNGCMLKVVWLVSWLVMCRWCFHWSLNTNAAVSDVWTIQSTFMDVYVCRAWKITLAKCLPSLVYISHYSRTLSFQVWKAISPSVWPISPGRGPL